MDPRNHIFYKTGDRNAPPQICDANGEVVLTMCRACGQAENEIVPDAPCPGGALINEIAKKAEAGLMCFSFENAREYLKDILRLCGGTPL